MQNYLDLMQNVRDKGELVSNRTGINTLMVPAAMLQYDLRKGFPAMTTKQLAFKQVKGELIGFLRGYTSAADFRALGCTIWDQNANEHGQDVHGNFVENKWLSSGYRSGLDDLGKLGYSHGWRRFGASSTSIGSGTVLDLDGTDQIANALHELRTNPESRRILVTAWNPAELSKAALPPCHVLFKLMPNPNTKVLHLSYYQRSCDLFLGVPFNIASYALLLELFCMWSGYTPGILTAHMDDVHLYVNHFDQVEEQLARDERPLPTLYIGQPAGFQPQHASLDVLLKNTHPDQIGLVGYNPHPPIKAPMAV